EKMNTIVMKVNIDCQGCRDKMRRALLKIDGMNGFQIDRNKVTANIKGNKDSDKIIKKISRRTGKHVEPWKEEEKPNEKLQEYNYVNNFVMFSEDDEFCTVM
ncbi:hypothetical protein KI387_037218, partial [Taxus chinensis]